MTISVTVSEV